MGLSVVEDLVRRRWNVAVVDLDIKRGREAEKALGEQVFFIRANVAEYEQQAEAFAQTWAKWGRLDLGMQDNASRWLLPVYEAARLPL